MYTVCYLHSFLAFHFISFFFFVIVTAIARIHKRIFNLTVFVNAEFELEDFRFDLLVLRCYVAVDEHDS